MTAERPGGPVEHALSMLTGLPVEPAGRAVPGEFRVLAPDAAPFAGLPGIRRAVAVPPRVYLSPTTALLRDAVAGAVRDPAYGRAPAARPELRIVSFSGPNVNKPLHLGHLRNNLIGMALATLLADAGHTVERQAPHCDWGIHICQALLAWLKWGEGKTPADTGEKGDHFVGRHYVEFHRRVAGEPGLEAEAAALMQAMEDGDERLRAVNHTFARWADAGIRETYARIGTRMDALFYDQDHLDAGVRLIADALAAGRCHRRADGSVYVDLTAHGLGEITLERRDGTPTVYRQWMAVNIARYPSRPFDRIHVVTGKEWEAGIGVLRETLRAFGHEWAARMTAVHYGLVVLPEGRMKSRQGSGVGVDGVLDELAADYGEPVALALLKHHFLGVRRSRDVVYDRAALRGAARDRFAAVVRALAWAEGADAVRGPEPPENAVRAALLHLGALPATVARTTGELEPAHLVRHLDETAAHARAVAPGLDPDDPLRAAFGVVLRRTLALLNVALPDALDDLPPPFTARRAAFA